MMIDVPFLDALAHGLTFKPQRLVSIAPNRRREDPKTKVKRKMAAKSRKINRRK